MNEGRQAAVEKALYRDGGFLVRDGLRLHYRDYPGSEERPPLLCLPGLTRNARDFEGFAQHHSPRFRVLALDFRGRGESDYDPQPIRYNPLTYAGDVLQFLDHAKVERAIFVGTSLGGLVTMALAKLAPQRIAAAILNDVGPDLSQAGLDRIKGYVGKLVRFADWDEAASAVAAINQNVSASYTHTDWVGIARRLCREQNGRIVFDYDVGIALPFNAPNGATPNIDMWPLFAALAQKPLLVVRGERSDLLSADAVERMRKTAPDAQFVVVPGVGHAPTLEEPEAVAAIEAFLATTATGQA
jgi:pimeloyl-ACP methyl ester carboxylesterase